MLVSFYLSLFGFLIYKLFAKNVEILTLKVLIKQM